MALAKSADAGAIRIFGHGNARGAIGWFDELPKQNAPRSFRCMRHFEQHGQCIRDHPPGNSLLVRWFRLRDRADKLLNPAMPHQDHRSAESARSRQLAAPLLRLPRSTLRRSSSETPGDPAALLVPNVCIPPRTFDTVRGFAWRTPFCVGQSMVDQPARGRPRSITGALGRVVGTQICVVVCFSFLRAVHSASCSQASAI
jgi:hypothetical protein